MPGIIILYAFIVLFYIIIDLIPLLKDRRWKEFGFYAICICLSFILDILLSLNIKLPSPTDPIEEMISYIVRLKD